MGTDVQAHSAHRHDHFLFQLFEIGMALVHLKTQIPMFILMISPAAEGVGWADVNALRTEATSGDEYFHLFLFGYKFYGFCWADIEAQLASGAFFLIKGDFPPEIGWHRYWRYHLQFAFGDFV